MTENPAGNSARPGNIPDFTPLKEIQWQFLVPGMRVAVQRHAEARNRGTVEQVAEGATGFWVWLDNGNGRIFVHPGASSKVWVETENT